jgi:putative flippase GtrA
VKNHMKVLARWGRFNLVGAVGMAVQLGTLALLDHVWPGHYLWATAAALEATLLHNFVWHLNYTWRDRRRHAGVLGQCLRFHLANGAVSLVGNLALMRLLVEGARMPVLPANALAILACSLVNFALGDQWVFGGLRRGAQGPRVREEIENQMLEKEVRPCACARSVSVFF